MDCGGIRCCFEDSHIKAINWARECKVDIISISWGLRPVSAIKESLEAAYMEGILIFAAASNHGRNKAEIAFPGRLPFVFCIGAATKNGQKIETSPSHPAVLKFSTLGVAVSVPQLSDGEPNQGPFSSKPMTGTSFATPIAAGMAARLLQFTRTFNMRVRSEAGCEDVRKIFLSISAPESKNKSYRWLPLWILVEDMEGKGLTPEQKRSQLREVLGRIVTEPASASTPSFSLMCCRTG